MEFGKRPTTPKMKCLLCPDTILFDCEANEIQRSNPDKASYLAREKLQQQLNELDSGNDECFGNFTFEDQCWKECDFNVRCLRKSGILAGEDCTFFHEAGDGRDFEENFEDSCFKCLYIAECKKVAKEKTEKRKIEEKEKEVFGSFYSLDNIREKIMMEE